MEEISYFNSYIQKRGNENILFYSDYVKDFHIDKNKKQHPTLNILQIYHLSYLLTSAIMTYFRI